MDADLVGESRVYYARKLITDAIYWGNLITSEPETIDGVTYEIAQNESAYDHNIIVLGTVNKYDTSSDPGSVNFSDGYHFLILKLTINDYSVEQDSLTSLASSDSSMEFLASSTVELTLTSAELLDNVSVASADLNTVLDGPTDAVAISAALGDTKTGMKDTVATDLESVVAGLDFHK